MSSNQRSMTSDPANFSKTGNGEAGTSGGPHRNNGSQSSTHPGNKPRTRASTGSVANLKLTAPRPLNLPSLRKVTPLTLCQPGHEYPVQENEGHDPRMHHPPAHSAPTGWQRPDGGHWDAEQSTTWAHTATSRNWDREQKRVGHPTPSTSIHNPPVLKKEDFPSLETAAHLKQGHQSKTKISKDGASGETKNEKVSASYATSTSLTLLFSQNWVPETTDQATSKPGTFQPTWEEDSSNAQVYGQQPMRGGEHHTQTQPHGFRPLIPHGYDPNHPYAQGVYYHPRPHFYATPGPMRGGFSDFYGHPGEGFYPAYYQPMYPQSMQMAYPHPELCPGPGMVHGQQPEPAPSVDKEQNGTCETGDKNAVGNEDFVSDTVSETEPMTEQKKLEAEHPKTPDNLSGEGAFVSVERQASHEGRQNQPDATQKMILRKKSLPKDSSAPHALKSQLSSEELDWGAQVEVELERTTRRAEVKIFPRPIKESQPPEPEMKNPETDGHPSRQPTREQRPVPPFSVPAREQPGHRHSSQTPRRTGESGSEAETPKTWRSQGHQPRRFDNFRQNNGWRRDRFEQNDRRRPGRQPDSFDSQEPVQGSWRNRRDSYSTERNYRGRGGRGRFGMPEHRGYGRGRAAASPRHRESTTAPATPHGRRLFPGRGFRPNGLPPRQGPQPKPEDVPHSSTPAEIQFGEFDMAIKGEFDPFAKQSPEQHTKAMDGAELHPMNAVGPARMDQHRGKPFVGHVLPEHGESHGGTPMRRRSYEMSHQGRHYGEQYGRFRPSRGRGRGGGRGGGRGHWQPGRYFRPYDNHARGPGFHERVPHSERRRSYDSKGDPSPQTRRPNHGGSDNDGGDETPIERRHKFSDDHRRDDGGRHGNSRGRHRGRGHSFDSSPRQGNELTTRVSAGSIKMHWVPKKAPSDTDKADQGSE